MLDPLRVTVTGVVAPLLTETEDVVPVRDEFVVRVTVTVYGLPVGTPLNVPSTPLVLVVALPLALYEYGPPVIVQL